MPIPQLKMKSPQNWKAEPDRPARPRGNNTGHFRRPSKGLFSFITPERKKRWLKGGLKYGTYIVIGVFFFGLATFAYFSQGLPNPNKIIDRNIAQSTKIYDRTGEHLLYEISGDQKRTLIELSDIPEFAVQATIVTEDRSFYKHGGISFKGILRSLYVDFIRGEKSQGGSTLTQQLVKNAILTREKKISRKIKEVVLAYQIESKFSKDEILKMYFNEIPYGSNAYGIEAASNYYFGKSARDINLSEATILAALPQAPSYYSPYGSNIDVLIGRQHYILDSMAAEGYITAAEAEAAKNYDLEFTTRITNITAPHFVFFVKEMLASKFGEQVVEQGGLRVITTLDIEAQRAAEEAIAERAQTNQDQYRASNAALVAIDVPTGQIISMVGSKDYFNDEIDGQVNVALMPRQPGSSFKPFVYLTGFTKGFTPDSILFDLVTKFKAQPKDYEPHNYDLGQRGPISIRKALAGSLNIPAVKMLYLAGVDSVLNLAEDFGYTTFEDRSRFGLALVLGGGEVKLLEHTNGFATLAREGVYKPYEFILKIEDSSGVILEEYEEGKNEKRAVETVHARMTNDILQDNGARAYIFGASNYLTLPDRPVAAKTGTTNDYHDAWTMGFTPYQIAAGVWVGNNDNSEMRRGADGSIVAAPIWQSFMKKYLQGKEVKTFTRPQYENPKKPMIGGYMASGDEVKIDSISGKLATEYTPEETTVVKNFKSIHNILHYVDPSDPTGSYPKNPQQDPQYSAWEAPVIAWGGGGTSEPMPTEYDDIHRPEDKPTISIVSPVSGQIVNDNKLNISVSAFAPRGIQVVQYFIDGIQIGESRTSPFGLQYSIPLSLSNGDHTLVVKAFDDIFNNNQAQLIFSIDREEYIRSSWINPSSGVTLDSWDFPFNLQISVDRPEVVEKVDFYYREIDSNRSQWIGYEDKPRSLISVTWLVMPPPGVYKVYPLFTDKSRESFQGPAVTVSIEGVKKDEAERVD
ncbi:MAG: transglycosylase domain-containing protein [Candidatus Komeilibacteria bacterium]|nr:transglycosylase domain-containing protein [Candidatus Komeilibacteria bacterium]